MSNNTLIIRLICLVSTLVSLPLVIIRCRSVCVQDSSIHRVGRLTTNLRLGDRTPGAVNAQTVTLAAKAVCTLSWPRDGQVRCARCRHSLRALPGSEQFHCSAEAPQDHSIRSSRARRAPPVFQQR